ncbi:hypothetical protein [Legionella resiliens]|uniref:Ankyrin repeat-containing protein n=1 Tax=Legionella resiliens TaxID=2905958 RepID=A0ABS8X135_9GAMM|nr:MULTISPECIES: hypothetical protein [unclassified Legionella]MCE0722525.1 hypothetical protein [Legionella sp. 9fVS26]MCE3531679.1 hypothetical protein [Legionella sp. 8cVS16]
MSKKQKVNTGQHLVIPNLNKYLKYHNLPIKLDEDGICNALATLYIQYVLEGKEKEFVTLLSVIAQKIPPTSDLDAKLFSLVEKIIALQVSDSQSTRNKYSQSNSHEQIEVKGKELQSIFQIGLKTSYKNWAEIIKQIDLKPNEAMRVCSLDHAIAIVRDGNGYKVYDPNNSIVSKQFNDVTKMTKWLSSTAYNFSILPFGHTTLDMHIDVISTDLQSDRTFPDKKTLLDKYLTPVQKKLNHKVGGGLHFAMRYDDAETTEYIFNDSKTRLSDSELSNAGVVAIRYDSAKALEKLIHKLQKENKAELLGPLFMVSCQEGSYRCFEKLLQIEEIRDLYHELISDAHEMILKRAFEGLNEYLISRVVDDVVNKHTASVFTPEFLSELIDISIKEKNYQGVKLLAEKINGLDKKIDAPEERLRFLKHAIKQNDPLMVRVLIEKLKMTKEELNCLSISMTMINKQNVEIFTILKGKGYEFSSQAADLIERKQKNSIGFLKSLGMALVCFSEFLLQQNKIKIDEKKIELFSFFKKQFGGIVKPTEGISEKNHVDLSIKTS